MNLDFRVFKIFMNFWGCFGPILVILLNFAIFWAQNCPKLQKYSKYQKSKFIDLLELLWACFMQILKEIGAVGKKP